MIYELSWTELKMLLFLCQMENADSIKIEKFKSIKDFKLSSEQKSTV